MEAIVQYFSNIPSVHRSYILMGGIAFFWMIEFIVPLFKFEYGKIKHAGLNIFFTITTILVNFPLAFLLLKASIWTTENKLGILSFLPENTPLWLYALIGLLVMDLVGAYTIHWLEHKVKWMWRFHIIHHSDLHVDTTTANRHHPGESVFRFIFTALAVIVTGAPLWLIFMYQSLSVALSQFNHANIAIPAWAEKTFGLLLVTPGIHHTHHHYVLPYTDSNYGNIFSIWDRIFGTFTTLNPSKLVYGIDTIMDPKENQQIRSLLKIPFTAYRNPSTID